MNEPPTTAVPDFDFSDFDPEVRVQDDLYRHVNGHWLAVTEIPADKPVVVQCHSGSRSQIGASLLKKLGRQDVMNLVGGIAAWEEQGLPVER